MMAAVLVGEPHVVEHRTGIKQLCIELEAAPHASQRAPIEDATGMVKEQRRLGIAHELGNRARQLAIGDDDPVDSEGHRGLLAELRKTYAGEQAVAINWSINSAIHR